MKARAVMVRSVPSLRFLPSVRPFGKSVSQSVQSVSLFLHEHPISFLSFVLG